MICGRRWLLPALLTGQLCWPGDVAGQQLFKLNQITSQLGFGFDRTWGVSDLVAMGDRSYHEWAQARIAGSLLDPRIARFDIGLNPTWRQRELRVVGGPANSSRGNQLNFIASVNALADAPVRLALNGSRFSGTELDPYGVRRDGTESVLGAAASYPNPYFRLTRFSFERRSLDASRRQFGTSAREQAYTQGTLQLTAENARTRVLLERMTIDDRLFGRDFTTSQAWLSNRLHWGKGSRLQSIFMYLDRDRAASLNWSQSAHLQHTRVLSSDYEYGLLDAHGRAAANRGRRWNAAARYQPRTRVNLGLEGGGRSNDFRISKDQWYDARTRLDFSVPLPLGAELSAGGSLGHTWFERTTSTIQLVKVLGERHVVDNSRRFALDNPFADLAGIAIGNRSGSLVFEAGFDYSLVASGAGVDVLVLPAGRISVGDTLFADYSFQSNASGRDDFRTVTLRGSLRLNPLTVSHQQTTRSSAAGDSPGLDLTRTLRFESRTRADLNLRTGIVYFRLSGERSRTESALIDATDYVLHGGFDIAPRGGLSGRLSFDGTSRDDEIRPFQLRSGTATLRWAPRRTLQVNARAGAWTLSQRDAPRQQSLTGGIDADWLFRSVTLRARYDHLAFSERINRTQNSVSLDVIRRF